MEMLAIVAIIVFLWLATQDDHQDGPRTPHDGALIKPL